MTTTAMCSGRVRCNNPHGQHEIAYTHWGDAQNPKVVLCLHGLTRNSRDFDYLAGMLATDYRVICMDVVGRGESDYLSHASDYAYSVYIHDVLTLLTQLQISEVDLVGTSMGGLIGMSLAALPHSPVKSLVLNDVGPILPQPALERIAEYLRMPPFIARDLDEAEAHIRFIYAPFGVLTDEQWQHLTRHSVRLMDGGGYRFAYDPAIVQTFQYKEEVNLWPIWSEVEQPVLLLRGAESDLLLPELVQHMQNSRPDMRVVEFAGVGHAPILMSADQIEVISTWLAHPHAHYAH